MKTKRYCLNTLLTLSLLSMVIGVMILISSPQANLIGLLFLAISICMMIVALPFAIAMVAKQGKQEKDLINKWNEEFATTKKAE